MYKIVVWLEMDYSVADEFECSSDLTRDEITAEVHARYPVWYFYDIW